MNPTPDQTCRTDNTHPLIAPKDDFSHRSLKTWRRFFFAIFAFLLSYLTFVSCSGSPPSFFLPTFLLSKPEKFSIETYLNQITHLSLQLDKKVIQASSLREQTFPMLVSRNIVNSEPSSPGPVDLICVFDFPEDPEEHYQRTLNIKKFLKAVLPLMNDQDRLSIVLLDGLGHENRILSILPFVHMTEENQQKTLSSLGSLATNILKANASMIEGSVDILGQREGSNHSTGIFLFSEEDFKDLSKDGYKARLGLQNVSAVVKSSRGYPESIEMFAGGLKAMRGYVASTKFLIKPEESELLKGVEIVNTYQQVYSYSHPNWGQGWLSHNGTFLIESEGLNLGLKEDLFIDIKLPKIPRGLLENPIQVKVASCEQVYILWNGTQVIKSFDLIVNIAKEEEEKFVNEDDREVTAMRHFYWNWGSQILWLGVHKQGLSFGPEENRDQKMLKRYKESLEDSIVKDDEELQEIVKRMEEKIKNPTEFVSSFLAGRFCKWSHENSFMY